MRTLKLHLQVSLEHRLDAFLAIGVSGPFNGIPLPVYTSLGPGLPSYPESFLIVMGARNCTLSFYYSLNSCC